MGIGEAAARRNQRFEWPFGFEKPAFFLSLIPGWMAQSAVVRDYRALEIGRRRAERLELTATFAGVSRISRTRRTGCPVTRLPG